MKKNHFIARKGLFSLALAAVGAMFLGSCAVDGFDDKEKFDDGVSGVKLESPELSTKTVAASDGSDKLQVSWKVVYGAGGYECKAYNVDDPDNPEEVASDTIDGTSFQFKIAEDTNYKIEVRTLGNKAKNNTEADKPTVAIYTSAQLKVKFINFDCSATTHKGGIIEMSPEPPASCSAESQGVGAGKNGGKPADVYILQDPIIIQDCAFKNVIDGLFSVGQCSWGIADVRVMNSVVQMRNDGKKNSNGAIICGFSNGFKAPSGGQFWYGGIKSITIKNSTIYNIESNSKNRMFRFNNKDLDHAFPTAGGSCTMMDNTFIRVYDKKEFGNNTPNRKEYVITYDNNIFYDCFRLQKFIQGNCKLEYHQNLNTVWGVGSSVDGTDKGKLATEEDAGFAEAETKKELDFTQPNFGLNFKATGAISSTIGDPRWK